VSFLRRLRGPRAPDWASFFSGVEYHLYLEVVTADLRDRGWTFVIEDDEVTVEPPSLPSRWEFDLGMLARRCHDATMGAWPGLVHEHVDGIIAAHAASVEVKSSWELARPLVKLRLFGPDAVLPDAVITFPIAHDLVAALALDLPTTVDTLDRDDVAAWPPADELYRIALDNIRSETAPDAQVVGAEPGRISVFAGDSFFVASRLLLLPELVDLARASGALVAVPNRHAILVHPILDLGAVQALSGLVELAASLYDDGPGSILPTVFWWHGGALTPLDARADGREVVVRPPDAFIELLDTLDPAPRR
jgi:hypothetical protein